MCWNPTSLSVFPFSPGCYLCNFALPTRYCKHQLCMHEKQIVLIISLNISEWIPLKCWWLSPILKETRWQIVANEKSPQFLRHVVAYNPYLTQKYNYHINVEYARSIVSVKYLTKYVYEGTMQLMLSLKSS